jgi:hypothetical protein
VDNTLSNALRLLGEEKNTFGQILVNMLGKDGQRWRKELRKFARQEECWLNPTFSLLIDPKLTLPERIALGLYDWHNEGILTWKREDQTLYTGENPVPVTVEYVHYGEDLATDEVERRLATTGYRPATIEELTANGAKNPDEQRQFPIVALGSVFVYPDDGYRCSPYLYEADACRGLGLFGRGNGWVAYCRFAAVRKAPGNPQPPV